jgi:ribosomal protein L11 methyltransferase
VSSSSATRQLVEVAVLVGVDDAELASYATGEFSPGGFVEETLENGGARLCVFVPLGDEQRYVSWLANWGIKLAPDAVAVTRVDDDWDVKWREFHQPVVIGDLWIGPPWQLDACPEGAKPVVIEPAQGFGTGAHPTTRLVLSLLDQQPRGSLLDLGCGSGVLTVAAAMLGFGPLTAIDNDPVAVESTHDNLERNRISGVDIRVLDALQETIPTADIVLANVILEPLVRIAPKMTAPRLVLSGLLRSQVEECVAVYESHGYVLRERRDRDGWTALVLDAVDPNIVMRHAPVW